MSGKIMVVAPLRPRDPFEAAKVASSLTADRLDAKREHLLRFRQSVLARVKAGRLIKEKRDKARARDAWATIAKPAPPVPKEEEKAAAAEEDDDDDDDDDEEEEEPVRPHTLAAAMDWADGDADEVAPVPISTDDDLPVEQAVANIVSEALNEMKVSSSRHHAPSHDDVAAVADAAVADDDAGAVVEDDARASEYDDDDDDDDDAADEFPLARAPPKPASPPRRELDLPLGAASVRDFIPVQVHFDPADTTPYAAKLLKARC